MKFADVSFYFNRGEADGRAILERHRTNMEYVHFLPAGCRCAVIKFMDKEAHFIEDGVDYHFFRGGQVYPQAALSFLKALAPDVVLIHGLIYSWQVFLVRKTLGKKTMIILQHHGETIPGGWRKWLIKEADSHVNAYFFTARAIAEGWIREGMISSTNKIAEVLTGSSALKVSPSKPSDLVLSGNPILLWVGRLDHNKDPLTIVEAFALLVKKEPAARMYMIYQAEETPGALQATLEEEESLKAAVTLVGAVKHDELVNWYLAADFFVSGSRREACGYALLEAMQCGCIPVVTDIPSFRKITAEGTIGFLFEPGNPEACIQALLLALSVNRNAMKEKVMRHFEQNLSFEAIAEQVMRGIEP